MHRVLFILVFFMSTLFGQNNFIFELFPQNLNFYPLKANYDEPRLGINYLVKTNNLKVDIGNSSDLFGFHFGEDVYATMGVDFFAFALATSFAGHRLQIDALDGFFGGNGVITKTINKDKIQLRLKILHNSAHFVDGHWVLSTHDWINGDTPLPYTRDFGEITLAYTFGMNTNNLKVYSSLSYATLVRPASLKRWLGNFGFEWNFNNLIENIGDKETNVFIASHFFMDSTEKYTFNNNSQIGIKFGNWNEKGIVFFVNYYKGNHYLSEYYLENTEQYGIGFYVDFN